MKIPVLKPAFLKTSARVTSREDMPVAYPPLSRGNVEVASPGQEKSVGHPTVKQLVKHNPDDSSRSIVGEGLGSFPAYPRRSYRSESIIRNITFFIVHVNDFIEKFEQGQEGTESRAVCFSAITDIMTFTQANSIDVQI
jgi:hypothetical protein